MVGIRHALIYGVNPNYCELLSGLLAMVSHLSFFFEGWGPYKRSRSRSTIFSLIEWKLFCLQVE